MTKLDKKIKKAGKKATKGFEALELALRRIGFN
jgi:hypothetical protein